MKKVLVTGADGFIGSHLTESLLEKGYDVKAFAYYNSFNTWGWLDTLPKEKLGQIEVFTGDIRDPNGVREAMKGVDGVFHLAALIAIPFSYAFPHRGHQLFFPFSVYDTERLDKYPGQENVVAEDWPKGEARHVLNLGLSTGWLSSHATVLPVSEEGPDAHEEASSVGRIDTTLSAVYENNHPIGSTRFGLTINAPTGQSRFYQSALVPKGLGFFEDFGKGWEFTPSIEGIHRVTERDSLSARLSYTIREPYKFSMEVPEAETRICSTTQ